MTRKSVTRFSDKIMLARALERVFPVGRFHRAIPGAVELLEHLFGRGAAGIDDAIERLQVPRFVAADRVDAAATTQARMCQNEAFLSDLEQIAVLDPRLEAEARHVVAQGLTLRRGPVLHQVPGRVERDIVLDQPGPER